MKRKKKPNKKKKLFSPKVKSNVVCVKTSLKSILKDYDTNFKKINDLVLESNEIVIRTYQFMRLFFLYKYYKDEDIPDIDKDTVLYFIRALGIRDKRGRSSSNKTFETELDEFYEKEFRDLINKPKFDLKNKSYLTPYLATQIQTGFNNNIKEHFITRFRHFMNVFKPDVKIECDKKGKELKKELNSIWNKAKNTVLGDKLDECPTVYREWATNMRNSYLPETYDTSFYYDAKCNVTKYLKYTIKLNEVLENRNKEIEVIISQTDDYKKRKELETTKCKLFQPISLRNSVIPHYITIDTNVILSQFKEKGESQQNKNTKENASKIWSKIFRTNRRVFRQKGYSYASIQTDGIGVSIVFKKDDYNKYSKNNNEEEDNDLYLTELEDDELSILKKKKIVAIDPGKHNLVMMLDENNNKLRYTACQRRIESLRKKCNKIMGWEKINNYIQEKESVLSSYNCKTVDYNKFKDYIRQKTLLNDDIRDFYERELFRKFKWRTQIYKRKSEDIFLNRIEKTYGKSDDIILSYGNWSCNKQMKHLMPTMNKGLRKIIEKKFNTVLFDEYKTSMLCCKCHNEIKNYKDAEGNKIHRLFICKGCCDSESKKTVFINRDINACVNILNLSKEWISHKTRNISFCRSQILTMTPTSRGET